MRIEILLKRSQIDLGSVADLLAGFFEFRTVEDGRSEYVEGIQLPDPDEEIVGANALVRIDIPMDERKNQGRLVRLLSPYSSSLYRLKLANASKRTLLGVLNALAKAGLDVGLVERSSRSGPAGWFGGERFVWPEGEEALRSTATEIFESYRQGEHAPLIDMDFLTLSMRSITRRKLRTAFLVAVLSLVCANFIYHLEFTISGEGFDLVVPQYWELPFAAGLMALICFLNLMEISYHERKVEIGTIRALGCETTTTVMIFASEGMILGTLGAAVGYLIVLSAALLVRVWGIDPGLDLVSVAGPGKAILGFFLGLFVGLAGTVPLIIPKVWRAPENYL